MPVHRINRTDLDTEVRKLEREQREEVVAVTPDGMSHVLVFTRAAGVEQR